MTVIIALLLGLAILFVVVRAAVRSGMKPRQGTTGPAATHDGRSLDDWAAENRRRHA